MAPRAGKVSKVVPVADVRDEIEVIRDLAEIDPEQRYFICNVETCGWTHVPSEEQDEVLDTCHNKRFQNAGEKAVMTSDYGGESLSDFCKRISRQGEKVVELSEFLQGIQHLCDGLDHAHEHEIYHHDVKPDNIVLQEDMLSRPRLIDFSFLTTLYRLKKRHNMKYLRPFLYWPPEAVFLSAYGKTKADLTDADFSNWRSWHLQQLKDLTHEILDTSVAYEYVLYYPPEMLDDIIYYCKQVKHSLLSAAELSPEEEDALHNYATRIDAHGICISALEALGQLRPYFIDASEETIDSIRSSLLSSIQDGNIENMQSVSQILEGWTRGHP
jgi:serine/threonine protein kinase